MRLFIDSFNKQCFSAHYVPGIVVCPGGSKRRKHSCWPLWRVMVGRLTHASWQRCCGRGCNGTAQLHDYRGKGIKEDTMGEALFELAFEG